MNDLSPVIIDLEKLKNEDLEESFLHSLGWGIKTILRGVFGKYELPVQLKGNPSDVRSFLSTLGAEKKYIENFKKLGLDNPKTYKSKASLDSSISQFQRKTGIKWPFK